MDPPTNMPINLPIGLTLFRITLVPVLALVFYLPINFQHLLCAGIFGLAAITDWLDGSLARRWKQTSALGAFLDPVADKLMVAVTLVLLVQHAPTPWLALPTALIIAREITVTALREWMASLGERSKVEVSWLGKCKTALQMAAIIALLLSLDLSCEFIAVAGYASLYLAAILAVWSMYRYFAAALPSLLQED